MPFRFFLLSLCLACASAQAEVAVTPEAPPAAPAATADTAAPAAVPLDATVLSSIGVPRSKAERDEMAALAVTLKEESALRREAAEKAQADAKTECWKKFLVSACLDDARVAYRKEISIAKRQERQSQSLERNVRKYDAAEHVRLRDEENARKDAENARKAAEFRAKEEARAKSRAGKQ